MNVAAALARFVNRFAVGVVGIWVLLAAAANIAVPQLEHVINEQSRSFFPADAASSVAAVRMGQVFGDSDTNNLAYLVLVSTHPLGAPERAYYDRAVAALRADTGHVASVMDLWSQPLAQQVAESTDHHAVYILLRLTGQIGSAEATKSVASVRASVSKLPRPDGLQTYVTGPGATIVDGFDELDRQLLRITAVTVVVIALLLFLVYRSMITAAIPLVAVGLSLAVTRPIVAALADHGVIEVSIFSVSLMSAMVLGAGTDYGIFLLGRYHENRRNGLDADSALIGAYRSVAPIIVASSLTIAAALFCLIFSKVSILRSAGIPCSIGILVSMVASLTLFPAFIGLASRRGLVEPHTSGMPRRWRRIGTAVARWPGPLLIVGTVILLVCALPLLGIRLSYDVPAFHSATTESNRGYRAADQHFPPNRLLPEIVLIQSDHDLRNPAGLIAIERVTRHIMALRGVQSVQSASRPAGTSLTEASLTHQAGLIGNQLAQNTSSLSQKLDSIDSIQATLAQLTRAVDDLERRFGRATTSLSQIGSGADDLRSGLSQIGTGADALRSGMQQLQGTVETVSDYVNPLRQFVDTTPDCPTNLICSAVLKVLDPLDSTIHSVADLSSGTDKFVAGATDLSSGADKFVSSASGATTAISGTAQAVGTIRTALGQLHQLVATLSDVTNSIVPQLDQISGYLNELSINFQDSGEGGFYLPQRTFDDPRFQTIIPLLFSADGRATRLLVYGEGRAWSTDGARRAADIEVAVHEATKEGTLNGSAVYLSGVGSATRDLQAFVNQDFLRLAIVALTLIFLIVALMLRSPVAGVIVVATVIASYASALGASAVIWRYVAGQELHFVVPSLSFIALVAVGADYNLLLAVRIKEEAHAGLNTGIIRAFGGTGGVVTTAGIVFGLTMLAMLTGNVLSIAQVGSTIGIGLLIDTLIVRTIIVPSIAALTGHWFWWPLWPGVTPWGASRKRGRIRSILLGGSSGRAR
jgi:RND superfamily putative drug exporter